MTKYTDSIYTTASTPLVGNEIWLVVQGSRSAQLTPNMLLTTGGIAGQIPMKNSSANYDISWTSIISNVAASTGISIAGSTTLAVALATTTPVSVLGVAGAATTNPAAIVGTGAQVLRVNDAGNALAFGPINLGSAAAFTGTLPIANISYLTSLPGLSAIVNSSSGAAAATTVVGTANQLLAVNGAATTLIFRSISSLLDTAIGSAQGMTMYRSSTNWTALGGGTNGQILQTQGTALNPQWVGGEVLLNTLSPNGVASTNDTTSFTTLYRNYKILFENVCPATNTATLQMTVSTTGSAFITTGYISIALTNVSSVLTTDTSTTALLLSGIRATTAVATTTLNGVSGTLILNSAALAATNKQINGELSYHSVSSATLATASLASVRISGAHNLSTALNGVNFAFASGNIATGTIRIFGVY